MELEMMGAFTPELGFEGPGISSQVTEIPLAEQLLAPAPLAQSEFGLPEPTLGFVLGAEESVLSAVSEQVELSPLDVVLEQGGLDEWLDESMSEAADASIFSELLKIAHADGDEEAAESDPKEPVDAPETFLGSLLGFSVEPAAGEDSLHSKSADLPLLQAGDGERDTDTEDEKVKVEPRYIDFKALHYMMALHFNAADKSLRVSSHTYESGLPTYEPAKHEPGHTLYQTPVAMLYTDPLPIIERTSRTMGYRVDEFHKIRQTPTSSSFYAMLN